MTSEERARRVLFDTLTKNGVTIKDEHAIGDTELFIATLTEALLSERHAALEEAAVIAEEHRDHLGGAIYSRNRIAEKIRAKIAEGAK